MPPLGFARFLIAGRIALGDWQHSALRPPGEPCLTGDVIAVACEMAAGPLGECTLVRHMLKTRKTILLTLVAGLLALSAAPSQAGTSGGIDPFGNDEPTVKGNKAKLVGDKAIAPANAPKKVKQIISAANRIRNKPYRYGGGHRRWNDRGYDCSGAVSYALRAAGLIRRPMTSGQFARWGKRGKGKWVTIYANRGHVFMVVAGLRWDTSYITDGDRSGPGWSRSMRPTRGFKKVHPRGL